MNLKLLLALTVLSLTACGTRPVKDDSPASDTAALKASLSRQLAPRLLPNGRAYCLELAKTEGAQDDCAADLEDGFYLSEQDKARALKLADLGLQRIELSRLPPCRWYDVQCKLERSAREREIKAAEDRLTQGTSPP